MRLMRNHKVWIYVRSANSNPQIAFDRMNDLIDEAAGHGFLVRGTSVDQCSGNTLKDRDGLRIMMESVKQNIVEAVMVRDLAQISRNSYILLGVIEIFRQYDVYLKFKFAVNRVLVDSESCTFELKNGMKFKEIF